MLKHFWLFLGLLFLFRLHNSLAFNPYWGYDGGFHLDYIFSLARGLFPDLATNTVAWHEPLYYLFGAVIIKIVSLFSSNQIVWMKILGVSQALISVAFAYASYRLALIWFKKEKIALLFAVILNALPLITLPSVFISNELLHNLLTILLLWFFFGFLWEQTTTKKLLLFALMAALALLTKVTAIISLTLCLAFMLAWAWQKKSDYSYKKIACVLAVIALMYSPWLAFKWHKQPHAFSVNNPGLLAPQPLKLDGRVKFFFTFDRDVLKFPFWYSGGRGFWSMLYADSFWDYYGILENKDFLAQANPDDLIKTTHLPSFIRARTLEYGRALVILALFPLTLMLLGLIEIIKQIKKEPSWISPSFFAFLITGSYFLALIYFAYRYPYYDSGIIKALYIMPAYLFPLLYGLKRLEQWRTDKKLTAFILYAGLAAYTVCIIAATWVKSFGH